MNGTGRERIDLNGTELDWKVWGQTPLNGDWTGLNWTGVNISEVEWSGLD